MALRSPVAALSRAAHESTAGFETAQGGAMVHASAPHSSVVLAVTRDDLHVEAAGIRPALALLDWHWHPRPADRSADRSRRAQRGADRRSRSRVCPAWCRMYRRRAAFVRASLP